MRRFWPAVLSMLLASACTIQSTPEDYIDRQRGSAEQLAISEAEISRRLTLLAEILEQGDSERADLLVQPHRSLVFFAPEVQPLAIAPENMAPALDQLFERRKLVVSEMAVAAGPQNSVAWFSVAYRSEGPVPAPTGVLLSGVYRRLEGDWQLIQAHASRFSNPEASDSLTRAPQEQ